jgi:hypothetical protein
VIWKKREPRDGRALFGCGKVLVIEMEAENDLRWQQSWKSRMALWKELEVV